MKHHSDVHHMVPEVRHTSANHRQHLKARLLMQMQENQMIKQPRRQSVLVRGVVFITGTALALLVIGAIPFYIHTTSKDVAKKGTNIVQQAVKLVTPQTVFAAAAENAESWANTKGAFYYTRMLITQSSDGCYGDSSEYQDSYYDKSGILRRNARYRLDGTLIENTVFNERSDTYIEHTFNQNAVPVPEYLGENCTVKPVHMSTVDQEKWAAHQRAIADAYGWQGSESKPQEAGGRSYLKDLTGGSPTSQISAFKKLASMKDGWNIKNDVIRTDMSKDPLVELSFAAGDSYERLYFNQKTHDFLGVAVRDEVTTPTLYKVVSHKITEDLH